MARDNRERDDGAKVQVGYKKLKTKLKRLGDDETGLYRVSRMEDIKRVKDKIMQD